MTEVRPTLDQKTRPGRTTLVNAFRCAFVGLAYALRTQRNLKIHLAIGAAVAAAGAVLGLSPTEWSLVILCIGLTWTAELLNTAVEVLVDLLAPEYHERARVAKDVAAAGVLCSALTAAAVGTLIFGARLFGE
jgi:diacylglycerol kinase